MSGNIYKTEEVICGNIDVVFHRNVIEAREWQSKGIDTKVFYSDGSNWVESGTTQLELTP